MSTGSDWNEIPAQPDFSGHNKITGLYMDIAENEYWDSNLNVLLLEEAISAPLQIPRSENSCRQRISFLLRSKRGKKVVPLPHSNEKQKHVSHRSHGYKLVSIP
jgi:hypothetical protein